VAVEMAQCGAHVAPVVNRFCELYRRPPRFVC
jgi:hypothetical protein